MPNARRFNPDVPAVYLYNPLDNRQPYPIALGALIQLLKQPKDLVMVARINADAVVPDIYDRLGPVAPDADLHMGIGLVGIVPTQRVEEAIGIVPEAIAIGEVVPRGDDAAVRLLGLAA